MVKLNMKIGRIATQNATHVISREEGNYRRVGNPRNKKIAEGIANHIPRSIVLYNQKKGERYHNIYKPMFAKKGKI